METLEGLTTGKYIVTTYSGTRHIIDLDAKTATRYGAAGREWGEKIIVANPYAALAGTRPKIAAHYEPITADTKPLHFTSITNATVGQSMFIENEIEWRQTSTVQSIEEIE